MTRQRVKSLIGDSALLVAAPHPGYEFSHWGGGADSSENTIRADVDGSKQFTAHFRKKVSGTGAGIFNEGAGEGAEKTSTHEREQPASEKTKGNNSPRRPLGDAFK